jgi:hypothetical protein
MTYEEAAAPQAGTIALQGIHDKGQVQPGQTVLINGAGGARACTPCSSANSPPPATIEQRAQRATTRDFQPGTGVTARTSRANSQADSPD